MTGPFIPKREDGRSAARVVADHLSRALRGGSLDVGALVTHDDLLRVLGMQAAEPTYYLAVGNASRILEKEAGRTLETVRGQGYRVVGGLDQVGKARKGQKKANRAMRKAVATVQSTDMALVPATERSAVRNIQAGMARLAAIVSTQAERLAEHDAQLDELASRQVELRSAGKATQEQLDTFAEQLAAMQAQLDARADSGKRPGAQVSGGFAYTPPVAEE